jgi:hypothetical protein
MKNNQLILDSWVYFLVFQYKAVIYMFIFMAELSLLLWFCSNF